MEICDLHFFTHDLINIYTFKTDRIPSHCEGTDEGRIFYLKGLDLFPCGYWCSKRCWHI